MLHRPRLPSDVSLLVRHLVCSSCNSLQGSVLQGSVLQGSVLQGSVLQGSVLQGSVLQGSVLQGSVLQGSVHRPRSTLFPIVRHLYCLPGNPRCHTCPGLVLYGKLAPPVNSPFRADDRGRRRSLRRPDLLLASAGRASALLRTPLGTHLRSRPPALDATNAIRTERLQPDSIATIPASALLRLRLRRSIDVPPVSRHGPSQSLLRSHRGWRWNTPPYASINPLRQQLLPQLDQDVPRASPYGNGHCRAWISLSRRSVARSFR